MANKIQVKRGVEANIPILDVGEPAFTTDTKKLFIGTDTGNMELATKEQINSLDANKADKTEVNILATTKANVTDLNQTNNNVNATNLRIDNLVIPISPENVNVEVTDAHNSIVKNKNFVSLKARLEESEQDLAQHKLDYTSLKGVNNGVVTPEMTSFIQPPSNIINKNLVEMGKGINSATGEIRNGLDTCVTNFIPVEYGWKINTANIDRMFFYRDDYSYINSNADNEYTIQATSAKYVRFVIYISSLEIAHANFGSSLLPYEEYLYKLGYDDNFPVEIKIPDNSVDGESLKTNTVTPIKTTFFNVSPNLFDEAKVLHNTSMDLSGNIITEDGRWLSDYIEVTSGETISITYGSYRIAGFRYDKTFINRGGITNANKYVIPGGRVFIRISGTYDTNPPETLMVNKGEELLPFEPYGAKLKAEYMPSEIVLQENSVGNKELKEQAVEPNNTTFFEVSSNIFNAGNVLDNTSVDSQSNVIEDNIRWLSDFIEVTPGERIYLTPGSYRIGRYNIEKVPLNRVVVVNEEYYVISSNTHYIRLSSTYDTTPPNSVMVNRGSELLPYEPYYVRIKKKHLPETTELDFTDIEENITTNVQTNIEQLIYENTSVIEPSFPKLTWETIDTGWRTPLWLSSDGEVVYGCNGGQLLQSTDEWITREQIGESNLPKAILAIRELTTGELLVSTARDEENNVKAKVYKTIGYDRDNPSTATFKEVLEVQSAQANVNNSWGFSIYENIVLISEYGLRGLEGSRRVYLSTDYGETFKVIFDLYTQEVEGRPELTMSAHVHMAAYDPYFNRIWLVVGDNPNTATYYSDDMGLSWAFVTGSNVTQYTGIMPLPDCVIFGSDRSPNGLHIYRRKDKSEIPEIKPFYIINDKDFITHVFELPFKRDWNPKTPTYFAGIKASGTGYRPVIMGFVDGKKAHLLWEADIEGDFKGNIWYPLGATRQGNIVAYMSDSTVNGYRIVKAKAPVWE